MAQRGWPAQAAASNDLTHLSLKDNEGLLNKQQGANCGLLELRYS